MAFNTKNLLTSADGHFIPQMYDAVNDTYVPLVQKEYYGKSTDTKPTTNVPTGASFLEMDTKNVFMYDGTTWIQF
jgi:hypothetical protein